MKCVRLEDLQEMPTTHSGVGKKKVIFDDGTVPHLQQLGKVVFQPGDVIEAHSHSDFSEIMYVLSGQGTMRVDGKEFTIQQDTCIAVEVNEMHSITVTGDKPLALLFWGIYTK